MASKQAAKKAFLDSVFQPRLSGDWAQAEEALCESYKRAQGDHEVAEVLFKQWVSAVAVPKDGQVLRFVGARHALEGAKAWLDANPESVWW
jgi:hypothetical protein